MIPVLLIKINDLQNPYGKIISKTIRERQKRIVREKHWKKLCRNYFNLYDAQPLSQHYNFQNMMINVR